MHARMNTRAPVCPRTHAPPDARDRNFVLNSPTVPPWPVLVCGGTLGNTLLGPKRLTSRVNFYDFGSHDRPATKPGGHRIAFRDEQQGGRCRRAGGAWSRRC